MKEELKLELRAVIKKIWHESAAVSYKDIMYDILKQVLYMDLEGPYFFKFDIDHALNRIREEDNT